METELKILPFVFAGESELLKYSGQDLNRQHLGRPYFRSLGKTYRIRNGYTVTLVCSIENLGKKSSFSLLGVFPLINVPFHKRTEVKKLALKEASLEGPRAVHYTSIQLADLFCNLSFQAHL